MHVYLIPLNLFFLSTFFNLIALTACAASKANLKSADHLKNSTFIKPQSNQLKYKKHEVNLDFAQKCPPSVSNLIKNANLESSDTVPFFSKIASQSDLECQVASVVAIAKRITEKSHQQMHDDFFSAVGTYSKFFKPDMIEVIAEAYQRIPYDSYFAVNYFWGLSQTKIDLRDELKTKIKEDWSFTNTRSNASTWHYFMYMATLGDKKALNALAQKIKKTSNGNDATNFLSALSELKAEGVDEILLSYANDSRTCDGADEPGLPISENVKIWMMMRQTP